MGSGDGALVVGSGVGATVGTLVTTGLLSLPSAFGSTLKEIVLFALRAARLSPFVEKKRVLLASCIG